MHKFVGVVEDASWQHALEQARKRHTARCAGLVGDAEEPDGAASEGDSTSGKR